MKPPGLLDSQKNHKSRVRNRTTSYWSSQGLAIINIVNDIQGVPKKCTNRTKSQPKFSAMGLNFTIDMPWQRLILLSLSKKRPKINHQTQAVPANGNRASALWLQQHSEIAFFWDTL